MGGAGIGESKHYYYLFLSRINTNYIIIGNSCNIYINLYDATYSGTKVDLPGRICERVGVWGI